MIILEAVEHLGLHQPDGTSGARRIHHVVQRGQHAVVETLLGEAGFLVGALQERIELGVQPADLARVHLLDVADDAVIALVVGRIQRDGLALLLHAQQLGHAPGDAQLRRHVLARQVVDGDDQATCLFLQVEVLAQLSQGPVLRQFLVDGRLAGIGRSHLDATLASLGTCLLGGSQLLGSRLLLGLDLGLAGGFLFGGLLLGLGSSLAFGFLLLGLRLLGGQAFGFGLVGSGFLGGRLVCGFLVCGFLVRRLGIGVGRFFARLAFSVSAVAGRFFLGPQGRPASAVIVGGLLAVTGVLCGRDQTGQEAAGLAQHAGLPAPQEQQQ